MGWCSGTDVFDPMVKAILDYPLHEISSRTKVQLLVALINALDNHDWDCHGDSRYYSHPYVQEAMRLTNSDEFDDMEKA